MFLITEIFKSLFIILLKGIEFFFGLTKNRLRIFLPITLNGLRSSLVCKLESSQKSRIRLLYTFLTLLAVINIVLPNDFFQAFFFWTSEIEKFIRNPSQKSYYSKHWLSRIVWHNKFLSLIMKICNSDHLQINTLVKFW